MRAKDAALQVLQRFPGGGVVATDSATPVRQHTRDTPKTCDKTCDKAPGEHHQPLGADYELAELLGIEGCRAQFLGAVDLVAHFSGKPWDPREALAALAAWWRRDVDGLTSVQWITSAAYADEVRRGGVRLVPVEKNRTPLSQTSQRRP